MVWPRLSRGLAGVTPLPAWTLATRGASTCSARADVARVRPVWNGLGGSSAHHEARADFGPTSGPLDAQGGP